MAVALNHIIVYAKDKRASARLLFAESDNVRAQHCAFLVSEAEFDAALERVRRAGIAFFAEFDGSGDGEINHLYGGRGFYFRDPNGHLFELITRPYGPTPERWRDNR